MNNGFKRGCTRLTEGLRGPLNGGEGGELVDAGEGYRLPLGLEAQVAGGGVTTGGGDGGW